jgi:hypothetical protein
MDLNSCSLASRNPSQVRDSGQVFPDLFPKKRDGEENSLLPAEDG